MRFRRFVFLVFVIAACSREQRSPEASTTASPAPTASAPAAAPGQVAVPQPSAVTGPSTPQKCKGDGSYAKAIDCYRMAGGFHFEANEGGVKLSGDMVRPNVGSERVRFAMGGEQWLGVARKSGLLWHRRNAGGGWERAKPPALADRLYQRVTLFPDPEKVEGEPKIDPTGHYRFTNKANGDVYEVWVSNEDGRLLRFEIVPPASVQKLSPPVKIALTQWGAPAAVDDPR